MPLDAKDRAILAALQADGSLANSALAERVDLSESTCLRRVKMLEQSGVIERYTAVLNALKVGMSVSFLVRITLKGQTDRDLGAFMQPGCAASPLTTARAPLVPWALPAAGPLPHPPRQSSGSWPGTPAAARC